jgi:DNA-binding winged helix-turn-helix (wHTH) protein
MSIFRKNNDCVFVPHRDGSIVMVEAKKAVRITPRESKMLDALLEAAPDPIAKEKLCEAVWPASPFADVENHFYQILGLLRARLKGTAVSIERVTDLSSGQTNQFSTEKGLYRLVGPMKHERFCSTDE